MTTNENTSAEKPLREYMLEVPVPLSAAEKQSYNDQLVELLGTKQLLESKKKQATKQISTDISKVSVDIERIRTALKAGEEIRMADVLDIWNNGVIETRRRSDNFVVRTRAATMEDRQDKLPGIDDEEDEDNGDEPEPTVYTQPGDLPPQDDEPELEHDGQTVQSSTGGSVHHMPDDEADPSIAHGDGLGLDSDQPEATGGKKATKEERRRAIADAAKKGGKGNGKSKKKK